VANAAAVSNITKLIRIVFFIFLFSQE
jgi:hypothetical protein